MFKKTSKTTEREAWLFLFDCISNEEKQSLELSEATLVSSFLLNNRDTSKTGEKPNIDDIA